LNCKEKSATFFTYLKKPQKLKVKKIKKKILENWQAENSFYQNSDTSRISKLIYQYEIYKMIKNLPGDVLEFGVFKGSSLIKFLTFREILENSFSRKFYAFDAFGKFPKKNTKKFDKEFIKKFEREAGVGLNLEKLNNILVKKNFKNFNLIKGEILKTSKNFIRKNKNLKIALMHLDMDTYLVTKKILERFYNLVSNNGIILIDDYGVTVGVTKAVDEFIKKKKNISLRKLSFYKQPSYIIKK